MNIRRVRIAAICLVGSILLAVIISPPIIPVNHGQVCNTSQTAIRVLLGSRGSWSENIWLPPQSCTQRADHDADAIWGSVCDNATGTCRLQMWKVGPHALTITSASELPQSLLVIEGWCLTRCGWETPDSADRAPIADELHYGLKR